MNLFSLNKWTGITDSEWITYHAGNDQARLKFLLDRIEDGDRILEAGCGCGFQAGTIIKEKKPEVYAGFDPNTEKIASCTDMCFANFEHIYLTNRVFFKDTLNIALEALWYVDRYNLKTVICTEVLEHVTDYRHAIEKLCGLVPEGGKLLVTVPAEGKLLDVPGHINDFNAGFLVEEIGKYVYIDEADEIVDTYTFIGAHK